MLCCALLYSAVLDCLLHEVATARQDGARRDWGLEPGGREGGREGEQVEWQYAFAVQVQAWNGSVLSLPWHTHEYSQYGSFQTCLQ